MAKALQLSILCLTAIIAASCNNQPLENKPAPQQGNTINAPDSTISTPQRNDSIQHITKADSTQVWVDSLDAIVKKGFKSYTDRVHHEKEQVIFIKASEALGNYYVAQYRIGKLPSLDKAMQYYQPVTMFREETDSELGDNLLAIKERNKLCKKVAALYDKGLLPASGLKSIYVGHYLHPEKIILASTFCSMSDNTGPTIRFIVGSARLTKSATNVLDRVSDSMRLYPARNIVVFSGGSNTELMQQVCWDQTNSVVEYLVEQDGISKERIFFRYDGPEQPGYTTVRFAKAGETGAAIVAPPHPGSTS